MPGSFNAKKTTQDSMYTIIRGIAKKVFFIALFFYFGAQVLEQFSITGISQFLDKTVLLGLILAGFIFMITFTERDPKQPRISRSDWALIGLFGTIAIGFNVILLNDLGIIGNIASAVLLLFAFGLILYVWSSSDENVRFSLFKRDRRYKFGTYIRSTATEWVIGVVAITLFLITSHLVSGGASGPSSVITTTTPTPTISIGAEEPEPTTETTPPSTATPEPTPSPTPVPASSLPSEYKVYVLNGSGISGVANEIRSLLQTNGITVHYAGDASTFDYAETLILFNPQYENLANAIDQILNSRYQPIQKRPFNQGERYSQYNLVVIHGQ